MSTPRTTSSAPAGKLKGTAFAAIVQPTPSVVSRQCRYWPGRAVISETVHILHPRQSSRHAPPRQALRALLCTGDRRRIVRTLRPEITGARHRLRAASLPFFPAAQCRHTTTSARMISPEAHPAPRNPGAGPARNRAPAQAPDPARALNAARPAAPRGHTPEHGSPRRYLRAGVSSITKSHKRLTDTVDDPGPQGPDLRKRPRTGPRRRQKTVRPTCARWSRGRGPRPGPRRPLGRHSGIAGCPVVSRSPVRPSHPSPAVPQAGSEGGGGREHARHVVHSHGQGDRLRCRRPGDPDFTGCPPGREGGPLGGPLALTPSCDTPCGPADSLANRSRRPRCRAVVDISAAPSGTSGGGRNRCRERSASTMGWLDQGDGSSCRRTGDDDPQGQ